MRYVDNTTQAVSHALDFGQICGRLANQEIQIHSGDGRTPQGGGRVTNQYGLQALLAQSTRDSHKDRLCVHNSIESRSFCSDRCRLIPSRKGCGRQRR